MAFKVNVQGVFTPLLDAINASKTGGNSSVEITYSLGAKLKASTKEDSAFKSGLSYTEVNIDVDNAFNVWKNIFNSAYQKNSKNKSALQITFKEVERDSDITISLKSLSKGTLMRVTSSSIELDPNNDWVSLRAVKGLNIFNYLSYGVGRLLGLNSISGVSVLNPNLLSESFIARLGLKVEQSGSIVSVNAFSNTSTTSAVTSSYGGNNSNLPLIYGCLDSTSSNYNSAATADDGSCEESIVVSSSRLLTQSGSQVGYNYFLFIGNEDYIGKLSSNGTVQATLIDPPLPITLANPLATSAIFYNDDGVKILYMVMDVAGNCEIFNVLGNPVSSFHTTTMGASAYLDPELVEGNPSNIKIGDALVFMNQEVLRVNTVDTSAHQIDGSGNIVIDCDTELPLGNFDSSNDIFSTNIRSAGLTAGFTDYEDFITSAIDLVDESAGVYPITLAAVAETDIEYYVPGESVGSRKLATFKNFIISGNNGPTIYGDYYDNVIVVFDMYSSNLYATYGLETITKRVRMNNGRPNGDGTYDYRYTLGATYSKNEHSSVTYDTMIISNFEGFTFDMYEYGIYGLSGKKWNSTDSTFTTPGVDAEVNLDNPTDHQELISQLPVVIGGKLFEDIGGETRRNEVGQGGYYSNGLWDLITPLSPSPTGNEVGYYNVAYAVKHGFILMRMYSYSPFLLRPDDGGIEAHICGGDPADAGVISAGGYTPISMTFSKDNNYLYAILRDPDTMDKYIGIYDITSGVASTISADVKMIADPLDSGASRIVTVGDTVFILSKDTTNYVKIVNADTFQGVTSFLNTAANNVYANGPFTECLPTYTENAISLTDDAFIDIGVYTILNNYELSSYIATPRGVLNANDPTAAGGLINSSGEWLSSASANDSAGNLLLTAAVTSSTTVSLWDREGNELRNITIPEGINYSSDNCIAITPILTENSYEVSISVPPLLGGIQWYNDRIYIVSTVTFTEGADLSATVPTNFDLGVATAFEPNTGMTMKSIFLPAVPSQSSNYIISGNSIYSETTLDSLPLYIKQRGDSWLHFTIKNDQLALNSTVDFLALGYNSIENTCFTTYTDASTVAVAMHTEDAFEIQVIDVLSKPMIATITMSAEAVAALNYYAANQNLNVARLEFSQDKRWLYVLLRDKGLDVVGNPSKLLKVFIGNSTIVANNVTSIPDFDYSLAFVGQSVPDVFTEDGSGNLDYLDTNLRSKSHLSGMFKAADGNIYTLFVNDGTVVPVLGKILNQNGASSSTPARHAPASIRLSDTPMNLGLYSPSLDLSNSEVTFDPETGVSISGKVLGCTDATACNFDPVANYNDGSCEYPDDGCDCESPNAYSICSSCYGDTPTYNNIGGVDYEPCQYCPSSNATNYDAAAASEEGSSATLDMCIYGVCLSAESPTACNGVSTPTTPGVYNHDESLCVYAVTGCECDGSGGFQNTTSGGNNTHCIDCAAYQEGETPPESIPEFHSVCGCGEDPIIDGWCDCDTEYPGNYCDCDGNPATGYCNGCSGDLENQYCGCGEDLLEEYQSNVGDPGICNCEGTPKILYYQDSEGDGLGNPNVSAFYCEGDQPEGWVTNSNDTNIDCVYDEAFTGYQNYYTGEFISGDTDAAGECNGNAFVDGCNNISYNTSNTVGVNSDGCCNDLVADCLQLEQGVLECVSWGLATQNAAGVGECNCGYMPSNDPNCSQCVPVDQVDDTYECSNCQNILEGECDCQGHVEDECGDCNGGNLNCTGCMDPIAVNYDPTAIVEGSCEYLTLSEVLDEAVSAISESTSVIPISNFQEPYALFSPETELDFNSLSAGYTTEEIDGDLYYLDSPNVTFKCQVISEDNPTIKCVNPMFNAEVIYTVTGEVINQGIIETDAANYGNINVPSGTIASYVPTYYFRITAEFVGLLETDVLSALFGGLADKIEHIKTSSGATYNPSLLEDNIGLLSGGIDVTTTNSGEGVPIELPNYFVYAITPKFNESSGSYEEFEFNFNDFLFVELACGGEPPTPICCESSGVQNPGNFSTNDEGELIADDLCEVCLESICIPEDVTTIQVCCDPLAIDTVVDYNGDIHECNDSLCNYDEDLLTGFKMVLTIYTEGLADLEGLKWVLFSKTGNIINQSSPIQLGQAIDGVINKEIQLSSYDDCMWFLPIGFDYNDVWKNVKLEIKNLTVSYAMGWQEEVLHSLVFGASPTKGGSVKINLGNSECLLGCSETTLQTEYCEKAIREDYTEFTDIILQVNTAGGDNDAFTDTFIEIINVSTGATLSYLETLTPSTEYVKTFRVVTDTKIGVKVINPNEGTLVYKLLSEFGDLITIKEV